MAETTAHDIQAKELNMLLVFKEFCDDIESMKDLFSRAELD